MRPEIVVADYSAAWPDAFEQLCERVWPWVAAQALRIDHVGSTSVTGLAAKPVIDMDVVVAETAAVPPTTELLERAGYRWQGDLDVAEREAFTPPPGKEEPAHHLYLVVDGSRPHADHILLRDLLRSDPEARDRYAAVKRENARRALGDLDYYVAAKAELVAELLARARAARGLPPVDYWHPDLTGFDP